MFERVSQFRGPTLNLVDAVSSIEDRLHFGPTATSDAQSPEDVSPQVIDKMDEKWWARKDSNLRPMDYESTGLTVGPIYINNIRTPIPRVCD